MSEAAKAQVDIPVHDRPSIAERMNGPLQKRAK